MSFAQPPPSRIAVLPPALADQIAAGEVVERAASVVKELCENAIDAGARRIDVEIEGGGRRLVRVVDDGSGMTPDEARLALRRHATSKIRAADDLWGLSTFGFRGEALPSIAAVARLSLATKTPGAGEGFRLTVEAGVETDARAVGIPDGTQIEIRDLFFNTPARLKFQKTEATEAANVSEAVLRLALAHPAVHFRLRAGGRVVLDLPAHRQLAERVRAAFARRGAGALHEAWGEEGGHQVRAFLAAPDEASTTARSTFLFVGRRFIRDRPLLHALALGYGDLLEKGRYPLAALFLEVPGHDLDINVHPQKMEVRFARAAEVYAAVRHVVGHGVARAPWLPAARGAVRVHTLPPQDAREGEGAQARPGTAPGAPMALGRAPGDPARGDFPPGGYSWDRSAPNGGRFGVSRSEGATGGATFAADEGSSEGTVPGAETALAWTSNGLSADVAGAAANGNFFRSLTYIGQFQRAYLICEASAVLVLIDQHAAHERLAYERLRVAHADRGIKRQRLLFAVPVELGADVRTISGADAPVLEGLGFEIDEDAAAAGRLLLRAVPEALKDADPKPLLRALLRDLTGAGNGGGSLERAAVLAPTDQALATMACACAVRAGDVLGRAQAEALLQQLDGVDVGVHRPHGRPILLRFPLADLERRFGRGQDLA